MRKNKFIIIILLLFLVTGCYNYNEINDLAVATAIGIDKKDDKYLISVEIVNTKKSNADSNDNSNNTGFTIYKAEGNSIEEAIKNISYKVPKKLYLSHLEVIVFSEEVASSGIHDELDFFFRNVDIRGDFYVLVAKDTKAFQVLEVITPIDAINSSTIKKLVELSSESTGKTIKVDFDNLIENYLNNNKEMIIPSIEIVNESKKQDDLENIETSNLKSYLKMDKTVVFKNDKLIGYIDHNDTLAYNILKNGIVEATIDIEDDDKHIETLLNNLDTDIKIIDENTIKIDVKIEGDLIEITKDIDINDKREIKRIENLVAKKIKKIILNGINKSKELNSDYFGFKDIYYKNNYKLYKKLDKNWYKNYDDLNFIVNVDINIVGKGNTLKEIKYEK